MIKSLGHHTIRKTAESIGDRQKNGPVLSRTFNDDGTLKERPPFAGTGYYFWEDNLAAAEWWGRKRYRNTGYRIFKIDIDLLYDGSFLDLIGNRQHLIRIAKMIDRAKMKIDCTNWKFYQYVEYFRIMEGKINGYFPYKLVRFIDSTLDSRLHNPVDLSEKLPDKKLLLNPFYVICVFEMNHLKLDTFTFVR